MTDDKKANDNDIKVLLVWVFCIPFDLTLLFSPLAVMRFIFDMTGKESTFVGLLLGGMFLLFGGIYPKISSSESEKNNEPPK